MYVISINDWYNYRMRILIGIIKEYLLVFSKHIESLFHRNPPKDWNKGEKGDVILIPGFLETWVFLEKIGKFANKLGFKVHVLTKLGRNIIPLDKSCKVVEEYIMSNNLDNLILIAHSKGGLIGKYFLEFSDQRDKVKKLITISTPFKGVILGKLKVFNLHELLPHSDLVDKLEQSNNNNHKVTNIYPRFDNHVFPYESLLLKGASNFLMDVIGHTTILGNRETLQLVVANLE
jgi:triacylglycerol lipase